MKNVLLTGATGFLGGKLLDQLLATHNYKVYTLSRKKDTLEQQYHGDHVSHFEIADLDEDRIPFNRIESLIHAAYYTANDAQLLGDSLAFTKTVFQKADCPIINLSSRKVYGQNPQTPWTEQTAIQPASLYGYSKYSTELLLELCMQKKEAKGFTNIRLAGLIGPKSDIRIVNKFIKKALTRQPIKIVGGEQQFSYIDIRDAVEGLLALLETSPEYWKPAYNLGYSKSYNIIELAKMVATIAQEYDHNKVKIEVEKKHIPLISDLDCSLLYKDSQWTPKYDMEATIRSIFDYQLSYPSKR